MQPFPRSSPTHRRGNERVKRRYPADHNANSPSQRTGAVRGGSLAPSRFVVTACTTSFLAPSVVERAVSGDGQRRARGHRDEHLQRLPRLRAGGEDEAVGGVEGVHLVDICKDSLLLT